MLHFPWMLERGLVGASPGTMDGSFSAHLTVRLVSRTYMPAKDTFIVIKNVLCANTDTNVWGK